MINYNHKKIEEKWQKVWEQEKLYTPDIAKISKQNKFYNLWMFPYPSAEGMHAGHAFASTGSDIIGRFNRMSGKTVFQPFGYDSFGIHSENYAIKINENPKEVVGRTTKNYERQMRSLGHGYDWTRTVTTSDSDYYRWTQWLFLEMYKSGLAYRKKAEVNFCPSCKTVLADEQVMTPKQAGKEPKDKNGNVIAETEDMKVCERCGTVVEKRSLDQWFFKITDYADKLLSGLNEINWSTRVKIAQKEWIGKKVGRKIRFSGVEIFTTRPETINSATFIAISGQQDKFTGKYVINPATNKKIPVWEAVYVLKDYGTGAIMGVPAYDERDMEFAKKHHIDIVKEEFITKKFGKEHTNYHLRDWLVSRQRYWGAPIPMIWCDKCEWQIEENLPVLLPEITDYKPEGNGRGPLANHPEFFETKCPKCGGEAMRETDVMDTFVDSSWYFLRYPSVSARSDSALSTVSSTAPSGAITKDASSSSSLDRAFDPEISKNWLPVDLYFGGAEHSVLHLMYARFVNMVMHDRGYLDYDEPFPKFFAHGLMIKDGAKMSKSRGNVVNPDIYLEKYGADALRMYVMFMGPMDGYPDFRDSGIEGMSKFLKRVWNLYSVQSVNLVNSVDQQISKSDTDKLKNRQAEYTEFTDYPILSKLHQTIKGVTDDIKLFKYNTSIAKIMELVNVLIEYKVHSTEYLEILAKLLAPFAPHMTEELWHSVLNNSISIHLSDWPEYDEKYLKSEKVTIAIQINGKLRSTIVVDSDLDKEEILKLVKEDQKIAMWLNGKEVKKEIFVPNKLINFVI